MNREEYSSSYKNEILEILANIFQCFSMLFILVLTFQAGYIFIEKSFVIQRKAAELLAFSGKYNMIAGFGAFISLVVSKTLRYINGYREKINKYTLLENVDLILLFIFLVYSLLSTIFSYRQDLVWFGNAYNHEGFIMVVCYATIYISCKAAKNENFKKLILITFLVIANVICIFAFFNNIFDFSRVFYTNRMIFVNSNHYGYYISIVSILSAGCILFSKTKNQRILSSISFSVCFYNSFISQSEGCILGVIAGVVFLIVAYFCVTKKRDKNFYINLAILVALFFLIFMIAEKTGDSSFFAQIKKYLGIASDESSGDEEIGSLGSGRVALWKNAIAIMKESPIIGKGLDTYWNNIDPNILNKLPSDYLDMPHNEYLQIGENLGIIPMCLYIIGLIFIIVKSVVFKRSLKPIQVIFLGAAFSYMICSFFGNTFTYTYPYFLIVLGLAQDYLSSKEDKKAIQQLS